MIVYDRTTYFDAVRASLFGGSLSQQQVDGQNAILAVWEDQLLSSAPMDDPRWLAYMLATTYHECAKKMWPIEEIGKGSGRPYGKKDPETGQTYFGRGFVQLTWRENYARATDKLQLKGDRDIEWHAEHALDLDIASLVMFRGMSEGWFTSKKLSQYFSASKNDPFNARDIINPDKNKVTNDVKMGDRIAGYHNKFLAALNSAKEVVAPPVPEVQTVMIAIHTPEGVAVAIDINGRAYVPAS